VVDIYHVIIGDQQPQAVPDCRQSISFFAACMQSR
jgi:hypothetical protein